LTLKNPLWYSQPVLDQSSTKDKKGEGMGDTIAFCVGFSFAPGVGSARISRLLDTFGDLERAWQADAHDLRAAGMGPKTIEAILHVRSSLDLKQAERKLEQLGI
jgi:predicted Rossmann fold nucleotide-binding protein DprA/Smf involved in DNA uptake